MRHGTRYQFLSALLTLTLAAQVQGASAATRGSTHGTSANPGIGSLSSAEGQPITIDGRVLAEDGTPAVGAVVVSSAGGEAVVDAQGSFSLQALLPIEADSVRITAVGPSPASAVGSRTVALSAAASPVWLGTIQLASTGTCTPSWLPTFGELPGTDAYVFDCTVFDDGSGPALFVGGWFMTVGGVQASRIAKWDGSTWTTLGTGMDGPVSVLCVFDDGSGDALYVGGGFYTAGGVAASRIAKWDGVSWAPLGSGTNHSVETMAVFDDGTGSRNLSTTLSHIRVEFSGERASSCCPPPVG